MNSNEFIEWLGYHSKAYPSLAPWLEKSEGTTAIWAKSLRDVSLEAGLAATDAMMAGDIEKPRGWSDHPQAVRRYAREIKGGGARLPGSFRDAKYDPDGNELFDCPTCNDTGSVSVLHPNMQREAIRGERTRQAPGSFLSCTAACTCEVGDQLARGSDRHRGLPRYDPDRMVPKFGSVLGMCPVIDPEDPTQIIPGSGYDPIQELFDRVEGGAE